MSGNWWNTPCRNYVQSFLQIARWERYEEVQRKTCRDALGHVFAQVEDAHRDRVRRSPLAPETENASAYLDQVFLRHEADQPTERQLDDEAENDWLTACALRFDGHLYAQKHRMRGEFATMLEWIGHAPEFNHDPPGLMAAVFLLQRGLMREGIRSKTSQAWKVFRQLFLRLCSHPVPDEYRLEDFCTRWEREYVPKLRIGQEIIQAMHAAGPYGTHLS